MAYRYRARFRNGQDVPDSRLFDRQSDAREAAKAAWDHPDIVKVWIEDENGIYLFDSPRAWEP
jgi:hypothetical protein